MAKSSSREISSVLMVVLVLNAVLLATVVLLTLDTIHVRNILRNIDDEMTLIRDYAERQAVEIINLKQGRLRKENFFHSDVQYLRRARRHVDNRDTLLEFLKYLSIGRNLPSTCIANHTVICLPGQKGGIGEKGNRGQAGAIGAIGRRGLKGNRGRDGSIGPIGMRGLKGDRGRDGSIGPIGMRGLKGDRGKSGPIGPIGRRGPQGDIGLPGPRGPVGLKGETGNTGRKGQKGADGKSIYSPIITSPPISVTDLEGTNATFFCKADGNPQPTIKWQFEKKIAEQSRHEFNGENGLTIYDIRGEDSGKIVCIANNLLGTERRQATLTVLVKPRVVVLPKKITAVIGSEVNINCTVKGNPSPNVTWEKAYGTLRIKGTTIPSGKMISFQNVRVQDTGLYICSAKNSVGNALGTSTLVVNAVPPKTCKEVFKQGNIRNGIYQISPDSGPSFSVFCDMKTDGGGWTVFQRRKDATVNFYRGWAEYKTGFGDLTGNFWLGLEHIHRLTNGKQGVVLIVNVHHKNGMKRYAEYTTFQVNNESNKYRLKIGGYSGNAGDSLSYHNGMYFTTNDADNDKYSSNNCAIRDRGAWWYKVCEMSNLNGVYPPASGSTSYTFMSWYHITNQSGNIIFSEMKVR